MQMGESIECVYCSERAFVLDEEGLPLCKRCAEIPDDDWI